MKNENLLNDYEKMLKDSIHVEHRLSQAHDSHVRPLNEWVDALRMKNPDAIIPYFDPWDAGINAEILFLLEAPGPKATHFVSQNNNNGTARNMFTLMRDASIPRSSCVFWNVVPWYIGSGKKIRPANSDDLKSGFDPLLDVLNKLPKIKTCVFMGKKAESIGKYLQCLRPDLQFFAVPHPSPLYCNNKPENRKILLDKLKLIA